MRPSSVLPATQRRHLAARGLFYPHPCAALPPLGSRKVDRLCAASRHMRTGRNSPVAPMQDAWRQGNFVLPKSKSSN